MTATVDHNQLAVLLATRHGVTAEDARAALIWARDLPQTMDFPQEARRAAEGEGDLDVVWAAYRQHQLDEKSSLMRKATRTRDFVGTPRVFWTGEVFVVRVGATSDGKTYYHCRDDKGRWVRLFCRTLPDVEPGTTFKLRAQVKAHEEYRGARVTSMVRGEVVRSS